MPPLTHDQKLWILTAHPDSLDVEGAPAWLVAECLSLGLIKETAKPNVWRLTEAGYAARQEMLDIT